MRIEYNPGAATGDFGTDAIEPVTNGEKIIEAVLQRPSNNLRSRTETLREFGNQQELVRELDAGRLYWSADPVVFDGAWDGIPAPPLATEPGSGRFRCEGGTIFIQPVNHTHQAWAHAEFADGPTEFHLTSKKYVYQGAHDIQIEVIDDLVGAPVSVVMVGGRAVSQTETTEDPKDERRIEVHIEGGVSTLAQVEAAIAGHVTANAMVTMTIDTPGDAFVVPITNLADGVDDIRFSLFGDEIEDFFNLTDDNLLQLGDGLAIGFATSFDKLLKLNARGDISIVAADLFNTRVEPERSPNSVPLFLATSDTYGYMANGDRLEELEETTLGAGANLFDDIQALEAALVGHEADLANPHDVTAAQVDLEGGVDRIATQINAGTGSINGTRVAVATTIARGTMRVSADAGGNPMAIEDSEKGAASGVAELDADGWVPSSQVRVGAYSHIVASRIAQGSLTFKNFIDFSTPDDLEIAYDGEAADGSFGSYVLLEGVHNTITLKLLLDKGLMATDDAEFDVNMYWAETPLAGPIASGSETESFTVTLAGSQSWYTISWDTTVDHPDLKPGVPIFVRLEFDMTSGATGELRCQYAELSVEDHEGF